MFSFFKKNKQSLNQPSWSSFKNPRDYNIFINELQKVLKNYDTETDFDHGRIIFSEKGVETKQMLLLPNLERKCLSIPVSAYNELIKKTIDLLLNQDSDLVSLQQIKDQIGIRVLPSYIFQQMEEKSYIGFHITEDLICFLIKDSEDSVANIKQSDILDWHLNAEGAFKIGNHNMREKYPYQFHEIKDQHFYLITADYYFAPNILLNINEFHELIGKYGSLVTVPSGSTAMCMPINDIQITDNIYKLSHITSHYHSTKPDPVSPNIYWYLNGEYTLIPFDHQQPNFELFPEKFIGLLKFLMEDN